MPAVNSNPSIPKLSCDKALATPWSCRYGAPCDAEIGLLEIFGRGLSSFRGGTSSLRGNRNTAGIRRRPSLGIPRELTRRKAGHNGHQFSCFISRGSGLHKQALTNCVWAACCTITASNIAEAVVSPHVAVHIS